MNMPTTVVPSDEVRQLLASATRVETPCGDGGLVWHLWGQGCSTHAPVVLLHGGSGSWTHWLRNIQPLADNGRRVLAADLPGFGDSAPPTQGTDADALPEPLEAGLKILLGDQACDLVGFSFGGMTGGFLAALFPERVNRLVLVGAPGLGVASRRTVKLTPWRHLTDASQQEAVHRQNLAALMLLHPESITDLAVQLHVANVLRDRMKGRSLAYTDALVRALHQVQCPVDAIYGREDALYRGRLDVLAEALRAAPGFNGLQLIEDAGHWVQFECPQAFNTALLAVLNDNPHP
ncbi:MAG: alpha/beta hydrolase [Rhodoferax sp.]